MHTYHLNWNFTYDVNLSVKDRFKQNVHKIYGKNHKNVYMLMDMRQHPSGHKPQLMM
jgi:hypothetical protein